MTVVRFFLAVPQGTGVIATSRLRLCMAGIILLAGCLLAAQAANQAVLQSLDKQRIALSEARSLASYLEREVAAANARLMTLAASPSLQSENITLFKQQLLTTPHPEDHRITLYDDEGNTLIQTRGPPHDLQEGSLEIQEERRVFLAGHDASRISSPVPTDIDRPDTVLVHVKAMLPSGKHYGLSETLSGSGLRHRLSTAMVGASATVGLADQTGRILASLPPFPAAAIRTSLGPEGVETLRSGWLSRENWVFHRSNSTGWISFVRYEERHPVVMSVLFDLAAIVGAGLVIMLADQTWPRIQATQSTTLSMGEKRKTMWSTVTGRSSATSADGSPDTTTTLLRRMAENSLSILYVRDHQKGIFIHLTGQTEPATGYGRDALSAMGLHGIRNRIHPADLSIFEQKLRLSISLPDDVSQSVEFRFLHHDGTWRWLQATEAVFARDSDGTPIQIIGNVQDISESQRARKRLTEISGQLLMMRDSERRRIARDLHDSTSQLLTGASMVAGLLRSQIHQAGADLEDGISRLSELIQQSQREIRTISYLLHPPLLDEVGFRAALEWYACGLSKQAGIGIHITFDDMLQSHRPPVDVEAALFRVVQEALSNAIRHGECRNVWISITAGRSVGADSMSLNVIIRDDGKGMGRQLHLSPDTHRAVTDFGVGIFGMAERIRQLNGWLTIKNHQDAGVVVEAAVPLPEEGLS